jgi:cytochrome c oxidase subunit 4
MSSMSVSATQTSTDAPVAVESAHGAKAHPTPLQYLYVAIILAVVTGIEVGLYYIDMNDKLMVALLMGLAFIKFAMVVAYFMHLKFDALLLRRLFITGAVLAVFVYAVALFTMDILLGH